MQTRLNKEQVLFLCDEVFKIKQIPPGHTHKGLRPEDRPRPRIEAMADLARRIGMSAAGIEGIVTGRTDYARPWVAEWRQAQNGAAKVVPFMHRKGTTVSDEQRALVRKLRAEGCSYTVISRRTGVPKGSIWGITHPNGPGPDRPLLRKRPQKSARPPSSTHLGQDVQTFLDAACEKERAAMRERHARELSELEETLAAKRQAVIDRLVDEWTKPA